MTATRRLMAVLAHPDDESLGMGGTLAKYAADGAEVSLVTATRGERGRFRGHRAGDAGHPGMAVLARIRESELMAASAVLGIQHVSLLDYCDQSLDQADARQATERVACSLRRFRPDVVLTFGPDGGYGHPDHIAISQIATAAIVLAADAAFDGDGSRTTAPPHRVTKLYYLAWPQSTWLAYQAAVRTLSATVDGVERHVTPWPDWAITTAIDTGAVWPTVWRAVSCHESQLTGYEKLRDLEPMHHRMLWSQQSFYRAFSLVNGGRRRETDLFDGVER